MKAASLAGNSAEAGAAFYLNDGTLEIFNSTIANHTDGYAVSAGGGVLTIVNSTIGLNDKGVEIADGVESYILNSVIVGNGTTETQNLSGTPTQLVAGTIGGTVVNGVTVTADLIFGDNTFDSETGTIALRNHFSNIAARNAYLAGYDTDGNYFYSKDNGKTWLSLKDSTPASDASVIAKITTDQLGNQRLVMVYDSTENGKEYYFISGAQALEESFIRVVTVNTDKDNGDYSYENLSLREAIKLANDVGGGVIVFHRDKMGSLRIQLEAGSHFPAGGFCQGRQKGGDS